MRKIIILWFMALSISSCKSSKIKEDSSDCQILCSNFLLNLYERRYDKLISAMDDAFVKSINKSTLDSGFIMFSNKIKDDYRGQIKPTFITTEKTFHENIPATFLVFKVESANKFGYYFFYVSNKTNKILLVSEFSRIKVKG